jgi:hypothetical protein
LLDDLGGLLGGSLSGRSTDGAGILGHVLGDRQDAAQHRNQDGSMLDDVMRGLGGLLGKR